jgi:hypothetical protein
MSEETFCKELKSRSTKHLTFKRLELVDKAFSGAALLEAV